MVGVDIGGATTDVFCVFRSMASRFNRTVSANLGMSYSISNVCAEAGCRTILRWVPFDMDERELRNRVKNKMIRPTTIPQTLEALIFEQAIAREALRLAYQQHKEFATTLKGVQQQRTVGDTSSASRPAGRRIVDNMALEPAGRHRAACCRMRRAWSRRPLMMIDAFEPEGVTELAKDSIFMMPHLGVLAQVHPQAALEVFERDCLIYLGTCVAAKGTGQAGQILLQVQHHRQRPAGIRRTDRGRPEAATPWPWRDGPRVDRAGPRLRRRCRSWQADRTRGSSAGRWG